MTLCATTTSATPNALPVNVEGIPDALAKREQWVAWRYAYRPDAEKAWTKEPVNPHTGTIASSTDARTWGTLAEALDYADRHGLPGIGFVFSADDPFAGIDLDACRDPNTGELTPEAAATVNALDSYAEASPSGTGVHLIVAGALPPGRRKEGPTEMYDRARYFTITGHRLAGTPATVEPRQAALDRFHAVTFSANGHKAREEAADRGSGTPEMTDADVIARARDAANGHRFDALFNGDTSGHGGDDSAADLALLSLLAFWTQDEAQLDRLFRRSGLCRPKWTERADYRQRTIGKALERTETYVLGGARVTVNGTGTGEASGPETTRSTAPEADWPQLDPDALYGLPGDVVRSLAPFTEGDPAATLCNFLVMFGNAVGPTPHALVGERRHHANEFAVLVGATSKGRKGTSHDGPLAIVSSADSAWGPRVMGGLSSGEGLVWAVRDEIRTTKNGEEVVTDIGVSDKRLLAVEEEFSAVCRIAGREGNTLSETIRRAWDGKALGNLTKNSPARCLSPHISMLGHVTHAELLRVMDSTAAANGFGNRFLWLCVKRSKLLPEGDPIPAEIRARLIERTARALSAARKTTTLRRDTEAKELWADVYGDLSEAGPGLFGAMTDRSEAHVLRLSLLYALTDGAREITADHLTAALTLWDYVADSARYIFGDALGDPIADRVLSALRGGGPLDRTAISQLFGRHVNAARLDRALEALLTTSRARTWQEETGGRSRSVWAAT